MKKNKSGLIVVGDRVLVTPDEGQERTDVGLYLPQTVADKDSVQSGRIVETGPGIILPELREMDEEPWKSSSRSQESKNRSHAGTSRRLCHFSSKSRYRNQVPGKTISGRTPGCYFDFDTG